MFTVIVSCVLAFVIYDNYNKNNSMRDKIQMMEFELAMIRYSVISYNSLTSSSQLSLPPTSISEYNLISPLASPVPLPSAPDYDLLSE